MSFITNNCKINRESELVEPELHDCEIMEIKMLGLPESRTLIIRLLDENGSEVCMTLNDSALIYCSGFRIQNVVSYVGIYSRTDCLDYLRVLEGVESTQIITRTLNSKIKDGDLGLVRVVPSVGCEVFCVCKVLTFS